MLDLFDGPVATQHTLRLLEEKCLAGVFSWVLEQDEIQGSDGAYALLGLPLGSPAPTMAAFRAMMHPEDRCPQTELNSLIAAGLPFNREFRIIQIDGRMRWLGAHVEFVLDSLGTPLKMVGVISDVTGRHEADHALATNQSRFRDLVTGVAPMVWVADPTGMITASVGWAKVTGRPDSAALGTEWLDCVHPDEREAAIHAWLTAARQDRFFESEFRLRQLDGNYRWYRIYATPVVDQAGEIREWNGLTVDIGAAREHHSRAASQLATGAQIRASRAILRWSVSDLCDASGVSPAVIRRLEEEDDNVPQRSRAPVQAVRNALARAGIDFVFSPTGKPGVRPASAFVGKRSDG